MVLIVCVFIFTFNFSLAEIKRLEFVNLFAAWTCVESFFYHSIFSSRQNPAKSLQLMPKSDIVEQGYVLSINRYKEWVHERVDHRAPQAILDELESIEKEITQGMKQLRGILK
jgi:hypothetical protein